MVAGAGSDSATMLGPDESGFQKAITRTEKNRTVFETTHSLRNCGIMESIAI